MAKREISKKAELYTYTVICTLPHKDGKQTYSGFGIDREQAEKNIQATVNFVDTFPGSRVISTRIGAPVASKEKAA